MAISPTNRARLERESEAKLKKLELLEERAALVQGLPHLYRWKYYLWMREYLEHTNRYSFLCAANQIGKSTTQWMKCIRWATDQSLWPRLWKRPPKTFWYLYPSKDVATIEWDEKIKPDLMPSGKFKDDPIYGWKEEWRNRYIWAIHFNSGVSIYIKTYAQDVADLQTGSVWAEFLDEELPFELYPELGMRLSALDGYFSMVFTATLGQDEWRRTMESVGDDEMFKGAWKKTVSLYDCRTYEDGTPSHWDDEQIARALNRCQSEAEIQRRIYGKFAIDSGRKFIGFEIKRNVVPKTKINLDWHMYAGVDIGSGGKNHPAAVHFIAVRPDFKFGRVFRGWRGDSSKETTASDILMKFRELKGDLLLSGQWYDYSSRDFFNIAQGYNEPFQPADKHQDTGVQLMNVLFKNGMLVVDDTPELQPLIVELCTLQHGISKTQAKDDAIDSVRYPIVKIPWDLSGISGEYVIETPKKPKSEIEIRRSQMIDEKNIDFELDCAEEIAAWNELYES